MIKIIIQSPEDVSENRLDPKNERERREAASQKLKCGGKHVERRGRSGN